MKKVIHFSEEDIVEAIKLLVAKRTCAEGKIKIHLRAHEEDNEEATFEAWVEVNET